MSIDTTSLRAGQWWQILAGSGWLLGDRCLRIILGFVVSAALARALGPSVYGTFIYASTLAALFSPMVSLGLERIVIRDLARASAGRSALLGAAGALRLVGGLLSAGLAVGASWFLVETGDPQTRLMVAIIAVGNVFLAADVIDWVFQSEARFMIPVMTRLIGFVVGTTAKLILAWKGAPIIWLAYAILGETILTGVLLAYCARKIPWIVWEDWGFRGKIAWRLLACSWPLLVAELATCIFQRVDLVILNHYASESEVGQYAVASKLAQAGFFLPAIVLQVFFPYAARVSERREVLAVTARLMTGLALMGFLVSLLLGIGARWIIPLLFGQAYVAAVPLLEILAWTNVFAFIGSCHALYLVTINEQRVSLRLTWMTALCNVVLNYTLIPHWQAQGAAMAATGAMGLTTFFGVAFFRESRPLFMLNLRLLASPWSLLANLVGRLPLKGKL